ncbi:MAG: hypothetical protein NTV58_06705 [Deltaproteobacteria bacterium]|nr:hypothetical protein [Deltaproteobacteria bacterium]
MENLKEIPLEVAQMHAAMDVERIHTELTDLAQAHNKAIGAGDKTEAARLKDMMRDRGTILKNHLDLIISHGDIGREEAVMWEGYRESFEGYIALLN